MKKFFVLVIISIFITRINATLQFLEEIRFDNKDYKLMSLALEGLPEYIPLSVKFPNSNCTALGRDYIGYWKIVNDSLFLDSIKVLFKHELSQENIPIKSQMSVLDIDEIMHNYKTSNGYFASWANGIYYIEDPDGGDYLNHGIQIYKEEIALNISGGKVMSKKEYHNALVSGHLNPDEVREVILNFPSEKIPFVKPGGIILSARSCDFDSTGKPQNIWIGNFRHNKRQEFTPEETDSIKALLFEFLKTNDILPVMRFRDKYLGYSLMIVLPIK